MLEHLEDKLQLVSTAKRLRNTQVAQVASPGVVNLRDNDYLALMRHPQVVAASASAVQAYGCSASGSPVVGGYLKIHEELESLLCDWTGYPSALLWPSGYSANRAFLQLILKKGDIVLADRLVHRSMLEGVRGAGARLVRYNHCDLEDLERYLKQYASTSRVFVLTESVFSMEGDLDDLVAMAKLKDRYPFFWVVDEAHAIGWYGPGRVSECGLTEQVDVVVGTLGKALASQGAFMLFNNPKLRDYCVNLAPEFMYSTYLAPALVGASLAAIEFFRKTLFVEQSEWRRMALALKQALIHEFPEIPLTDAPIVPLVVGKEEAMLRVHERLSQEGVLTGAIRPPSVPVGTSRIRMSLQRGLDVGDLTCRVKKALAMGDGR